MVKLLALAGSSPIVESNFPGRAVQQWKSLGGRWLETKLRRDGIGAKHMCSKSHSVENTQLRRQIAADRAHFGLGSASGGPELNKAFTEFSFVFAKPDARSEGTSEGPGTTEMKVFAQIAQYAVAIREFIAPSYRPERHYMRGPGPAYARRHATRPLESRITLH